MIPNVTSRINDAPLSWQVRDGAEDFVSPHTINEIFVAGVTRFQLQLLGDAEFRFMVCLDGALDAAQPGSARFWRASAWTA